MTFGVLPRVISFVILKETKKVGEKILWERYFI